MGDAALVFARDTDSGMAGIAFSPQPSQNLVVELSEGAFLIATVTDGQGEPLAEAKLFAIVTDGGPIKTRLPVAGISDEAGLIVLGPLPTNMFYEPLLAPDSRRCAVDENWPGTWGYKLQAGERVELPVIVLNRAGRELSGTVVDQADTPVAGAMVVCASTVRGAPTTTRTDDAGEFRLTGLQAYGVLGVVAIAADGSAGIGQPCDPAVPFDPVLTLQPATTAQGLVTDDAGLPYASAIVSIQSDEFAPCRKLLGRFVVDGAVATDARGRWRVEGLVSGLQYDISVRDWDKMAHGDASFIAFEAEHTINIELTQR